MKPPPRPRVPAQLMAVNGTRNAERETRLAEAWALRIEGHTVRQIAERLSCSVSTAHEYLRTTLEELKANRDENADHWRRLQLARLDGTIADWLPISRNQQHPECARAAAICIKAIEVQSRLMGLLNSNVILPAGGQSSPAEGIENFEARLAASPAMLTAVEDMIERVRSKNAAAVPAPKRVEPAGKPE